MKREADGATIARAGGMRIGLRRAARRWGIASRRCAGRNLFVVPRAAPHEVGSASAGDGFETKGVPVRESVAPETRLQDGSQAQTRVAWPVLTVAGTLEARIARTEREVTGAQRLRYRVFYEEMGATPTPKIREEARDFDRYDAFCDHMLVVDHAVPDQSGDPAVIGTYRLLRGEVAARHGGFYTAGEFDLAPLFAPGAPPRRYLELGRSCVLKEYRAKPVAMQMLWRGIVSYLDHYAIDVMLGCGSLPGTDPDALALPLSYLHHYHRAPEDMRVHARTERYVEMNRMAKEAVDVKAALRALPPLIKGYVRAGCLIGEGAVIDPQFGTTDVLIYFPVSHIDPRWRTHFGRPG